MEIHVAKVTLSTSETNPNYDISTDSHLKDRILYGVLIDPPNLFVFRVNSVTSGNHIQEKPAPEPSRTLQNFT